MIKFRLDSQKQRRRGISNDRRIHERIARLAAPELTKMGRPGLVGETFELIEAPYIIVYKVFPDEVRIVSIVHGARDR